MRLNGEGIVSLLHFQVTDPNAGRRRGLVKALAGEFHTGVLKLGAIGLRRIRKSYGFE